MRMRTRTDYFALLSLGLDHPDIDQQHPSLSNLSFSILYLSANTPDLDILTSCNLTPIILLWS